MAKFITKFIKGDVVIALFPFSDLSQAKKRPALVMANLQGDDVILCQITSQNSGDRYAIEVTANDFESGGINRNSYIRPNRIFTAEQSIILYVAGHLTLGKVESVTNKIIEILS